MQEGGFPHFWGVSEREREREREAGFIREIERERERGRERKRLASMSKRPFGEVVKERGK